MSTIGDRLEKRFSLEGKVALITGASGGIGSALAKGLSEAGAKIAICDLNPAMMKEVEDQINAAGGDAASFELDLLKKGAIKACVDAVIAHFGHIDILINGSGINKREGILDVEEETYDRIMDINLKGTYFMGQEVAKRMILAKRPGSIINIASINARRGLKGVSIYGATKGGVVCLTRCQGMEWAKHNIRANAIGPGWMATPLVMGMTKDPDKKKFMLESSPMLRLGDPDELVGAVIYLASDASSFMTGETMYIDGGLLAGGNSWEYDTKW